MALVISFLFAFGAVPAVGGPAAYSWAYPLSDPRKEKITVRQLFNHTWGLCPEATGAPNDGR